MPVVQRFHFSRVVLYAGDHAPAHVHVQLRDGRECIVELGSMDITGRVRAREIREELDWIEEHSEWLREQWNTLNP